MSESDELELFYLKGATRGICQFAKVNMNTEFVRRENLTAKQNRSDSNYSLYSVPA